MLPGMTTLGVIFPPDLPPEQLRAVAQAADRSGVEQLWIWEDCFKESGIATATAALAWTERLAVGIGLLPVPLRNVALTAMEIATVDRLFPGRLIPGVGQGVLDWMGQVGARASSPMTLLREYASALRALLHGETLTVSGQYVTLTDVALDWPPETAPPLLVGAVRPRTVALAGEVGDGAIFTGETTPAALRESMHQLRAGRQAAHRPDAADAVVFAVVQDDLPAEAIAASVREYAAAGATHVALLGVGGTLPLERFASFVGEQVRPLLTDGGAP
jgi:alkanesulfonate monooxygenase SsuD/methylene tetrahydromethanopterin reductase-like flavin-dependent oxidoreductase (luciferase family)